MSKKQKVNEGTTARKASPSRVAGVPSSPKKAQTAPSSRPSTRSRKSLPAVRDAERDFLAKFCELAQDNERLKRAATDHPPMYAVRWNKLLDIVMDIATEQADRERSGHAWGQSTIDKLDELRDPAAIAIGAKPTKEAARPRAVAKRSGAKRGQKASPKKKK
jgi:hypothetical protein